MNKLLVIIIGLSLSLSCNHANNSTTTINPPNIILILTDDQGYGELACHGNTVIQTPHLDKLHSESTRFTNFHVAPTCSPTRAQLMSGKHEFRVGVTHTIFKREQLSLKVPTLAEILKKANYTTSIFGKWHLGDPKEYRPDNRGFDEALIHGGGGLGQVQFGDHPDNAITRYYDPTLYHNGIFEKYTGYCTDIFFDEAMAWIAKNKQKTFFTYISTNTPHKPHIVDEKYYKPYVEKGLKDDGPKNSDAKYYGMITNIDDNIGRLMSFMDKHKLLKNTLVIFMTDNGQTGSLYNAGMRGGKGSPHEGGGRVPCFFRLPNRFTSGDVDAISGAIDILPTLSELAGISCPNDVEGKSLVPLLNNHNSPWQDRFLVIHKARWNNGDADKSKYASCGIRSQNFRMINNIELYDMVNDPGETINVIDKYPNVVKNMRSFYDKWWDKSRSLMINEDKYKTLQLEKQTLNNTTKKK